MSLPSRRDIGKYLRYIFEKKSFVPDPEGSRISEQAMRAAAVIRGLDRQPAIIIHGILPRSGTVYVGELLRQHPHLHAFPNDIWELPFLRFAGDFKRLESEFLWSYEQNKGKIGEQDFLPIFGSALIAYLHEATPPGRRMLLKVPSVQYLTHFQAMFPHEHLLILVRDGRDVVQSTLKTWPQLRFSIVARRWRRAAEIVLAYDRLNQEQKEGYLLARFEDVIADPQRFLRSAFSRLNLSEVDYPFDKIGALPVRGSATLRHAGNVDWTPVTRPKDFKPVGNWRNWSSGKIRSFKRIAGQALIDLGYESNNEW